MIKCLSFIFFVVLKVNVPEILLNLKNSNCWYSFVNPWGNHHRFSIISCPGGLVPLWIKKVEYLRNACFATILTSSYTTLPWLNIEHRLVHLILLTATSLNLFGIWRLAASYLLWFDCKSQSGLIFVLIELSLWFEIWVDTRKSVHGYTFFILRCATCSLHTLTHNFVFIYSITII